MKTNGKLPQNHRFTFPVSHSEHSKERAIQRDISDEHIQAVLNFSESFFKQGMIFHIVKLKLIPGNFDPKLRRKIENLVVVIAGDSDTIITCYRTKNPMKCIKKKSCNFQKYRMAG